MLCKVVFGPSARYTNFIKIKGGYADILTIGNYNGEYQGTITVSQIITSFGLTDKIIITVICKGGNYKTDGAIFPKHGSDGSTVGFSGPVSGTYRMYFEVFYI